MHLYTNDNERRRRLEMNTSPTWNTKYGRRRVRNEPPALEEAIFAARGLTDDVEEQVFIVEVKAPRRLANRPAGGRAFG
jgi:hypothetical protein